MFHLPFRVSFRSADDKCFRVDLGAVLCADVFDFLIVFESGTREENLIILNQIRKDFAKKRFSFMKDSVTVSGGYAWFDVTMDLDSALKEAKAALASAKNSGKNMIKSTGESEDLKDV